ncbi:hypothetical protein BDQ17DRAFT_1234235 [Cyathus striatus]|nr:hypothetical protein BDQ17DRAFT_1234235 [Cyathus striatus]
MTTDSPSPRSVQKHICPPSPTLSPAQAIADAWKRESLQSQEQWRRIDVNVRTQYSSPRKPNPKPKM